LVIPLEGTTILAAAFVPVPTLPETWHHALRIDAFAGLNRLGAAFDSEDATQAMSAHLSVWQELLLLGLAGMSLVYILYFRIWLALAMGSDLLFAAALALAVASVAVPTLFDRASTELVNRSPLPSALEDADAKVAAIEALPGELLDRALAQIGYEPDLEAPSTDTAASIANQPGPFVEAVRPSVESLISTVLRFAGFACGSFLMFASLTMRSSTSTARKLQELAGRIDGLEAALPREESPALGHRPHPERAD
jgi:hypothetical protein